MHYSRSISGCARTCAKPPSVDLCDTDFREGCECDEGHVLSGDSCVPLKECGCSLGGNYYPVSSNLVSVLNTRLRNDFFCF